MTVIPSVTNELQYLHPPVFDPVILIPSLYDGEETEYDLACTGNHYQFQATEKGHYLHQGRTKGEIMPLDESPGIIQTME